MSKPDGVSAEQYRLAADDRYKAAVSALRYGHYTVAHYLAGVAVECMLRAYLRRITPKFDPTHELNELARMSAFLSVVPEDKLGPYGVFNEINLRWRNSHRYYNPEKLRSYLVRVRMNYLVRYDPDAKPGAVLRGDVLRPNANRMVDLAADILLWGERRWNRWKG